MVSKRRCWAENSRGMGFAPKLIYLHEFVDMLNDSSDPNALEEPRPRRRSRRLKGSCCPALFLEKEVTFYDFGPDSRLK